MGVRQMDSHGLWRAVGDFFLGPLGDQHGQNIGPAWGRRIDGREISFQHVLKFLVGHVPNCFANICHIYFCTEAVEAEMMPVSIASVTNIKYNSDCRNEFHLVTWNWQLTTGN